MAPGERRRVIVVGVKASCLRGARHHIDVMVQSYESSRAALDNIIERYRGGLAGDRGRLALTREQAIELIKALGFTRGDALRWLDPKSPRR
jgi:hypothetical protein